MASNIYKSNYTGEVVDISVGKTKNMGYYYEQNMYNPKTDGSKPISGSSWLTEYIITPTTNEVYYDLGSGNNYKYNGSEYEKISTNGTYVVSGSGDTVIFNSTATTITWDVTEKGTTIPLYTDPETTVSVYDLALSDNFFVTLVSVPDRWVSAITFTSSSGRKVISSVTFSKLETQKTDVSGKANLAGGNTFTGKQIFSGNVTLNGTSGTHVFLGDSSGGVSNANIYNGNGVLNWQFPNQSGTVAMVTDIPTIPTTTTAGKVLKSTATAGTVEWGDAAASGVTSITAGTGLTGGTITSTGTITVDTDTIATVDYVDEKLELGDTDITFDSAHISDGTYTLYGVPTTTTSGKVLKSTSTAGTVEWGDATGATYTAGAGINISSDNVIAATTGDGLTYDDDNCLTVNYNTVDYTKVQKKMNMGTGLIYNITTSTLNVALDEQDESIVDGEQGLIVNTDVIQSKLTFDSAPTASSTKPVTSGGIKTYVDGKLELGDVTLTLTDSSISDGTTTMTLPHLYLHRIGILLDDNVGGEFIEFTVINQSSTKINDINILISNYGKIVNVQGCVWHTSTTDWDSPVCGLAGTGGSGMNAYIAYWLISESNNPVTQNMTYEIFDQNYTDDIVTQII